MVVPNLARSAFLDFVRQQLECRNVDEMETAASGALQRLILLTVVGGRFTFDGALDVLARPRAAVEEGPGHSRIIEGPCGLDLF